MEGCGNGVIEGDEQCDDGDAPGDLSRDTEFRVHLPRCGQVVRATARSFLHNQVRSMVGTLKKVGEGKWTVAAVGEALAARDRARSGPVAPPDGLYLVRVDY